jgi:hypothetical protein
MPNLDLEKARGVKRWVLISWPAFLAACLLEALVFATIDPREVHWPGQLVQPSPQAVYTVAFLSFWVIAMACSSLVLWLGKPTRDVNDTARG